MAIEFDTDSGVWSVIDDGLDTRQSFGCVEDALECSALERSED